MGALRGLVLEQRLGEVDPSEARVLGDELPRGLDAELEREHRPEAGDLHRAESRGEPVRRRRSSASAASVHALGMATVLVGDERAQLLDALRHRP